MATKNRAILQFFPCRRAFGKSQIRFWSCRMFGRSCQKEMARPGAVGERWR